MTDEQHMQIALAKRRIRQLGHQWIAEGNPAGAFTEALRTVEGFGLHWPQGGSDDGKKGAA